VLGDQRYEHERAKHRRWQAGRIALHATLLAFEHPVTGETCRYEVPLPEEFHRVIPFP
jgi:23S rRNA-/tRNA-specific pseudouridylate synthase